MNQANRLQEILPHISGKGFGAWALGGEYWGGQKHSNSVKALHKALALGVNHFDTAPVYGKGRSEQLIGQQMKKIRSRVYLASKVFYSDPDKMKASFETSLKRMLSDYIDIFYIHWPLSGADMRPGLEMLEELRREGRIRAIGVSNFNREQLKSLEEAGTIDVFQGGYNLFWTDAEDKLLPYLKSQKIAFIPYGVLAQGILTNAGVDHLDRRHEGFRHKMILYSDGLKEELKEQVRRLIQASAEEGFTLEQAATAWTSQRTEAASVLLGCRNRRQAEANFVSAERTLSPELTEIFNDISRNIKLKIPTAPNLFNHKS